MKAYQYSGAGQLELIDLPDSEPGDQDVIIQAAYVGVAYDDPAFCSVQAELALGNPLVPGRQVSATVAAVGMRVPEVKPGDRVLVRSQLECGSCGICESGQHHLCQAARLPGLNSPGFLRERTVVPAGSLHFVPDDIPLRQAVLCHDLAASKHAVKLSGVKPGDYALVLGASLSGIFTALAAEQAGADVVVFDLESDKLEFARSLGIDVLYASAGNLVEAVLSQTRHAGADRVFHCAGISELNDLAALVRCRGSFVALASGGYPSGLFSASMAMREIQILGSAVYRAEDLDAAIHAAAGGKLPLRKLIAEVHDFYRLLEQPVVSPPNAAGKTLISFKES